MPIKIYRKKLSIAAIFFTFFIDTLCWSLVFPIFAPFFLDLKNHLFSSEVSIATRTTVLGFFLASFSLGQFIGAPLLGEYGDCQGRKKALCISVFFTFITIGLTALSIQYENLHLLFVGRLLTGLFAGNMSICLASIADLHKDKNEKVKFFGYLGALSGSSFVIGAFLGGKLSDPSIYPFFTPYLPFWIATGLTFGNFLFVLFGFQETSSKKKEMQFHILKYFSEIKKALQTKKIKLVYLVYFLFLFAWTILLQFTPVLVVQNFGFSNSNIADLALFMGVCWAIGSAGLNKILLTYFQSLKILEGCLLGFTLLSALIILPTHIYGALAVLAGCIIIGGLAWPLCTGLISNAAPDEMQGKILGMSQATQSVAMTLAPSLAGIAYQVFDGFPFLLASLASLAAAILYYTLKDR